MIAINIDKAEVEKLCIEKIEEILKDIDTEAIFWDRKGLERRTSMSWNSIQEYFFFEPNFPKFKIGQKWYFPAREVRIFLEEWIRTQKNS